MTTKDLEQHPEAMTEAPAENTQTGEQQTAEQLFAGKYHSVEALEQGYRELSRLVREKTPEVPEAYELDLSEFMPEGSEPVNLEGDLMWQAISPAMREAGLSNQQAEAVTKAFIGFQKAQMHEEQQALEAMGIEGKNMVHQVRHFIGKSFDADEQGLAYQLASSLDGIKFLNKVAHMAGEKSIPADSAAPGLDVQNLKEKAKAMLADPELKFNRQKQEAYNNLWKDITALS